MITIVGNAVPACGSWAVAMAVAVGVAAGEVRGFAVAVGLGDVVGRGEGEGVGFTDGLVDGLAIGVFVGAAAWAVFEAPIITDAVLVDANTFSVLSGPRTCVSDANLRLAVPLDWAVKEMVANVPLPCFGSVACEPKVIDVLPSVLFVVPGTKTMGKNVPAVMRSA